MAIATANVDPSQSFYVWLNRTNELATRMTSNVVTADSTSGGSLTNGNSYVNGHFGAVTLYANTLIGGNVSTNAAITVVANVLFVNSTSNLMTLTSNSSLTALTVNASATRILSDNTVISGGNLTINTATVSFSSNVNFASALISGNLTINSSSLFLNNGNLVFSNTPISGNVTLQSNLTFASGARLIANGEVGSNGNVLLSNGSGIYWGTAEAASIIGNSGIVSNSTGVFVNANSGLVANSTGLFAVGNTGLASNSTGIHVVANSGIVANATGVFVRANSGIVANSSGVFVNANSGLVANSTGTFVQANSGILANSTGVFVNANSGLVANATGVFVNTSYISTLTVNAATYANTSATNTFTVGTASYFLANGNLGIANTTADHKLRVQGDISLSGGIHANGSFGTSGQVLTTNGSVSYWSTVSSGSGLFNTNLTNSAAYAVNSTMSSAFTAPSTVGQRYIVYSIHVTNIGGANTSITGEFQGTTYANTSFATTVPVPADSSVELLKMPKVMQPSDLLKLKVSDSTSLHATVTYEAQTSTSLFGVGVDVTSDATYTDLYTASSGACVLQSLLLSNDDGTNDVKARVVWTDGFNNIYGYYCYDLIVPADSTVEIFEQPKYLISGFKVRVYANVGNRLEAILAGKVI